MTATAVIVRPGSVPQVADATVGAPAPAVDDLAGARDRDLAPEVEGESGDALITVIEPAPSTPSRDFFAGCVTTFTLPRYDFPLGPPSPLSRSLADVVREVAA